MKKTEQLLREFTSFVLKYETDIKRLENKKTLNP